MPPVIAIVSPGSAKPSRCVTSKALSTISDSRSYPEVFAALRLGVLLLLDDGKLRFEVIDATATFATVRVLVGGTLRARKGVSVVGAVLPMSALTEKDRKDLTFALDMGADWIALSFVQ